MSLDNFDLRPSWFALLAIYLGCVLLLTGCIGAPRLPLAAGVPTAMPSAVYLSPASAGVPGQFTPVPPVDPTTAAEHQEAAHRSLLIYTLPGKVIAHGAVTPPTAIYSLTTYTVEQIDLPAPIMFAAAAPRPGGGPLEDQFLTVDRFWRVHIRAAQPVFFSTSLRWDMWANGTLLGFPLGSDDDLVLAVFDAHLLPEGSSLAVSYNQNQRDTLPERIHYTQKP